MRHQHDLGGELQQQAGDDDHHAAAPAALAARERQRPVPASGAGSGWPPSTLSTTALSGHGASAREADFEERQRDDGQDARPVGPQEGQGPPGKRHPLDLRSPSGPARRRGAAAKSRWAGFDSDTAVTPLELASFT